MVSRQGVCAPSTSVFLINLPLSCSHRCPPGLSGQWCHVRLPASHEPSAPHPSGHRFTSLNLPPKIPTPALSQLFFTVCPPPMQGHNDTEGLCQVASLVADICGADTDMKNASGCVAAAVPARSSYFEFAGLVVADRCMHHGCLAGCRWMDARRTMPCASLAAR